jgi:hypothetical protein
MNGSVRPSMEALESRRLMTGTFATGGLCLIPPPAHPPTPAPIPVHHHHRHRAGAAAPSLTPVGDWAANSIDAFLQVRVSQARTGDLFAKVAFTGDRSFQSSGQLNYSSTTGQFTMWVMSPKLVVKFSGTLITDIRNAPEFQGSLESYTRQGTFKAQFVLQKTNFPPAGSL